MESLIHPNFRNGTDKNESNIFDLETGDMTKLLSHKGEYVGKRECFVLGITSDKFYLIKALVIKDNYSKSSASVMFLGKVFGDTNRFVEYEGDVFGQTERRSNLGNIMCARGNGFNFFNTIEEAIKHLKEYYTYKKEKVAKLSDNMIEQLDSPSLLFNNFYVI